MLDLRDQVTVFVITVGSPDLPDCLDALQKQDCRFRLDLIENVAPMDRAFQQMIDRCQTPYFIQVDEDMILYPQAVRRLYEHLSVSPPKTAMFFLSLLDTDLNYPIVGVKIYRHAIYKDFPFVGAFSCETNQNARLKAAGYSYDGIWREYPGEHVVGEHGRNWTPLGLFERYKRMAEKMRLNPKEMGSWGNWAQRFLDRLVRAPTQRHLMAFLGWMTGLVTDLSKCQSEKDFRDYDAIPEWQTLQKHFALPDGPMQSVLASPFPRPEGPRELNVYLTPRCNFKCPWCRRQSHPIEEAPDVTPDYIQGVMSKWPTVSTCCIAGFGEPLLSDQLVPVVQKAKARGLFTSLITNGSLILQRQADLKSLPLDAISVSLNAATAEEHEVKTGTKTWADVLEGVRWLRSLGKEVQVSFVLTRQDLPKMEAYLSLAQSLDCGVDFLSVLPHAQTDRSDEAFWKEALLTEKPEIPLWIERAKQHPYAARVRTWPKLIRRDKSRCPGLCDSPAVSLGIDGNGSITGCRRVMPPAKATGNYYDPTAWTSDPIAWLRQRHKHRDWPDLCSMCHGNW